MRNILLINNEATPDNMGLVERAEELGLPTPFYNVENLKAKLSEFGKVEVVHYHHLNEVTIKPDCIFLSGRFTDWDEEHLREDFADELALIRETDIPLFGICAGVQLIGLAYDHPIVYPDGGTEYGFLPQKIECDHPLLCGLETLTCFEHHRGQVDVLLEGFALLASRELCRVQMMAQRERVVFGTQFHPEIQDAAHRDGQKILQNFFDTYVK